MAGPQFPHPTPWIQEERVLPTSVPQRARPCLAPFTAWRQCVEMPGNRWHLGLRSTVAWPTSSHHPVPIFASKQSEQQLFLRGEGK